MRTRSIFHGKPSRNRICPAKKTARNSACRPPTIEILEDRTAPASLQHSLYPADTTGPQETAQFGFAVAADANFLVVGAPYTDVGGSPDIGKAFLYNAITGALVATLNNPTPSHNDYFGTSVAVSGDIVVIGGDSWEGKNVFVFNANSGSLIATLVNPESGTSTFGQSVAVSGNRVVVGNPNAHAPSGVPCGATYIFDANTGALLTSLLNPTPASNDSFGYSVAVSGNSVIVGAVGDDTAATGAGTAYAYNLSTGVLVATLFNPNPSADDLFGSSVAVSGTIAVVGDVEDDTGAVNSGSAFLFDVNTGGLIATLGNPTPGAGDRFGISVAVSGSTIIVGADGDDSLVIEGGCAYAFSASTGSLTATVNPTPTLFDHFGNAVAIVGNTAVIGANYDDTAVVDAGSATVLSVPSWSFVTSLENPTFAINDGFGGSLAMSGNYVVVGAPDDDGDASNSGIAYVFNSSTGLPITSIPNPSPAINGRFGRTVAVSQSTVLVGSGNAAYTFSATTGALLTTLTNPNPNNGGIGWSMAMSGSYIVVGAPFDDSGASDSGKAYVLSASTGALIATLNNPAPAAGDSFGYSVAIDGSIVVVGAYLDDAGAVDSGTVYAFDAATGALLATLNNPTPGNADQFGRSIALSGNNVAIGAWGDDTGASNAGSAYIFNALSGGLVRTLNNPAAASGDRFGRSVAVSNGMIVVGGDGGVQLSAYVFDLATGAIVVSLNNPTPSSNDIFGAAVAIVGNTIVIADSEDSTQNILQGAAYVYSLDPVTVTSLGRILPDPRNSAVSSVQVVLTANVNLSTFTSADFTLTRNGGPNLLTGAQTVSLVSGTIYQINGLAGLTGVDGTYVLTVNLAGVNDTAGQAGAGSASDTWVMDTAAPQITGVYFDSTAWSASFRGAAGMTANGYPAENGATQFASLPWNNVNVIRVRFNEAVAVTAANLGVRGLNTVDYFATAPTFTYDSATFIASWTLTGNIGTDRIILDLDGDSGSAVMDLAGNKLAGSWTEGVSSFPTTGAAGNDFKYRFVVAVGDASRNGQVRNADVNLVRANLFVDAGQAGYNIYADIDGNGLTRNADVNLVRSQLFNDPPSGPGPNRPAKRAGNHRRNDDGLWGRQKRLVPTRADVEIPETLVRHRTAPRLRINAIDALFMEM